MSLAVGIDLGGTQIKAVLVERASGRVLQRLLRPTRDGERTADGLPRFAASVRAVVEELEAGRGALPVGLSAPGLAHPNGRCIQWMPGRMQGLEGLDWPALLQREVRVLNDAQSALLGELWLGAARGCRDVILLTLGTGVGGAVVSGGRLLTGALGRAGHLGHVTTDLNAPRDAVGTPGSLEAAIGNLSLAARGGGRYANTHALLDAFAAGNPEAGRIWLESVRHLSAALAGFINVLDPERILLGGGIAIGAGERLLQPLAACLDRDEWRPTGRGVPLALAALGEEAGALGAVRALEPLA